MEPVRVGIVGVGGWGSQLYRGATASGALLPVACFSRSPENREAFAAEKGIRAADSLEALLSDPEVEGVIVVTPHSTHVELIEAAAAAGKHVIVDKPFTLTVEEGRRAIEAAANAGVVLQVGHQRRRQPANRRIRQMIDDGVLGTVIAADTNYSNPGRPGPDPGGWRSDPSERPLSGLTPFGVHVIDTLHSLIGPISRVSAHSTRPFGKTGLDDGAVLAFEFASGAVGTLVTSTTIPTTNTIGIFGTEGAAWNDQDGARLLVQSVTDKAPREEPVDQLDTIADQMSEFARCIRTGEAPEVGGSAGLRVIAVMEAAIASAAQGRAVNVEMID